MKIMDHIKVLKLKGIYRFRGQKVKLDKIISGRLRIRQDIVTEYHLVTCKKGKKIVTTNRQEIKEL